MHHLPGVTRESLANLDDRNMMKGAFDGQVVVDDFRDKQSDEWKEQAFRRFSKPAILHRRTPNNRRRIYRIRTHRYRCDMKNRIWLFERVKACVVSKGSFNPAFGWSNKAFQDKITICGYFNVDCFAADHVDWLFSEEACECHFVDAIRERRSRRVCITGISPQSYRNGNGFILRFILGVVTASNFVALPVHPSRFVIVDLNAVHTNIATSRNRVFCKHHRQRNKASAIKGPTL